VEYDDQNANGNLFGSVSFSNRFSGFPYADFLLGIPTSAARAFPFVRVDRLRWQYDFFVQDDIKLTPKLTFNVGLRYEYHPVWIEEHGRNAWFDITTGKIAIPDGSTSLVSSLMPKGYVEVVEASSLGLPGKTLIRNDKNNWLPRIGLAYRPWGDKTVIRTGFGLFYDVVPRNLTMGGIPYVINEPSHTNTVGNPEVIFPRVFPATSTGGPSTVGLPAAVDPGLQIPYSMQWNLTLEHTRWDTGFRLSYIGTNTRHGDYAYNYNSPVPDSQPFTSKPRPFPTYPGISYYTNGAGHQYHGMTVEAERQMTKGLFFQSSWVWARDIGDLERGQSTENPFDRARERAVWADVPTHRFSTNMIYQLPFGTGKKYLNGLSRAADMVVGGWEISAIYSYHSGQFLTATWTGIDPTGTAYTTGSAPTVTIRPDMLRDPNLPSDERSVSRWFDAGAFAAPAKGRFGTSAKNVIKGPWVNVWHMGFFKKFELTEQARLRWELTATNIFNHPNWSNPATSITSTAQVGVISSVGGVNGSSTGDQPYARSFRMGLRFEW
jgi:outer membrane receptor protein involved in Fe transport